MYSYLGLLFVPIYMIQRAIEAINRVKDQNELENLLSRQRMSRQTRAAKEDGKIDILKNKCFDKIPNCKRELCVNITTILSGKIVRKRVVTVNTSNKFIFGQSPNKITCAKN